MSQPTDVLLVTQVALFNDRRSFDKLVLKYQSAIRRFFMHLTNRQLNQQADRTEQRFSARHIR